jgi:hypothetical protein
MADNRQIKDGLGNLFTIRMRDISAGNDGTYQRSMVLSSMLPVDYGGGGSYHRASKSGVVAANTAAASPIYSFQWPSQTSLALIRRLRMSVWSVDVGFTAGMCLFEMMMARGFTAQMTGGVATNLTGDAAKLRTSMASSQASIMRSDTAPLTGGTYIQDAEPGVMETWATAVGSQPYTPISMGPIKLFEKLQGEMPLLLAQNEGFFIRSTVPQTGTWSFTVMIEWDEVPNVGSGY